MPDQRLTAYAWRAFLARLVCTKCTTSRRMGAVKTAGRGAEPLGAPAAEYTVTVGRAAILQVGLRARGRSTGYSWRR